jgi:hypothetical protein
MFGFGWAYFGFHFARAFFDENSHGGYFDFCFGFFLRLVGRNRWRF